MLACAVVTELSDEAVELFVDRQMAELHGRELEAGRARFAHYGGAAGVGDPRPDLLERKPLGRTGFWAWLDAGMQRVAAWTIWPGIHSLWTWPFSFSSLRMWWPSERQANANVPRQRTPFSQEAPCAPSSLGSN